MDEFDLNNLKSKAFKKVRMDKQNIKIIMTQVIIVHSNVSEQIHLICNTMSVVYCDS